MVNKLPITFLGEIHFSFAVISELIDHGIIPEIVIIRKSNFAKFDLSIFKTNDHWTKEYENYHFWHEKLAEICSNYDFELRISDNYEAELKPNKFLIVAGFSQILKQASINLFEVALNIHPSLLPFYRGPQPEAQMIINREDYFGITIHRLTSRIDSGDVLFQQAISTGKENAYELELIESKVAAIGVLKVLVAFNRSVSGIREGFNDERGSYFSNVLDEEICINQMDADFVRHFLRLIPEEFPFYVATDRIIYPISISTEATEMKLVTEKFVIYLNRWIEVTLDNFVEYRSLT